MSWEEWLWLHGRYNVRRSVIWDCAASMAIKKPYHSQSIEGTAIANAIFKSGAATLRPAKDHASMLGKKKWNEQQVFVDY